MNLNQIRSKIYLLTSTSGPEDFPDDLLVNEVNNALERVVSLIIQASGRWQYDDSNRYESDGITERGVPIATTRLNENQQDYVLDVSHIEIVRVEIKDTEGSWHLVQPIDQADVRSTSITDYMKVAGQPKYYDKSGVSVYLYPKPNYTQDASLKLFYQRPPSYFTTSDTTKVPGYNALYHDLLPLWTAYNFALANGKENAQNLMTQIQMREDALVNDYALRDRDDHIRLKASPMRWN